MRCARRVPNIAKILAHHPVMRSATRNAPCPCVVLRLRLGRPHELSECLQKSPDTSMCGEGVLSRSALSSCADEFPAGAGSAMPGHRHRRAFFHLQNCAQALSVQRDAHQPGRRGHRAVRPNTPMEMQEAAPQGRRIWGFPVQHWIQMTLPFPERSRARNGQVCKGVGQANNAKCIFPPPHNLGRTEESRPIGLSCPRIPSLWHSMVSYFQGPAGLGHSPPQTTVRPSTRPALHVAGHLAGVRAHIFGRPRVPRACAGPPCAHKPRPARASSSYADREWGRRCGKGPAQPTPHLPTKTRRAGGSLLRVPFLILGVTQIRSGTICGVRCVLR